MKVNIHWHQGTYYVYGRQSEIIGRLTLDSRCKYYFNPYTLYPLFEEDLKEIYKFIGEVE